MPLAAVVVIQSSYSRTISCGLRPPRYREQRMANASVINSGPVASPLVGHKSNPWFNIIAGIVVVAGIIYAGYHLADDLSVVRTTRVYPYILLGIALLIALGFEFVNGFHDT